MNQLPAIKEAARKAGEAMKHHDTAAAQFHINWARAAIRLEDDKAAAEKAFEDFYREGATVWR